MVPVAAHLQLIIVECNRERKMHKMDGVLLAIIYTFRATVHKAKNTELGFSLYMHAPAAGARSPAR